MKLIAGLGNPGSKYRESKHNAGFLIADAVAEQWNIAFSSEKFDAIFGKGVIKSHPVIVAKPQTYMNLSGIAIERLARFFKVEGNDVIVIHDELDLEFGDIRIKVGGGDGGHKGLRSVIDCLGGPEHTRIRFGIGKPAGKEMTERYVLEPFSEDEMKRMPGLIARAVDALVEVVSSGAQVAMNKFNVRVTQNSSKEVGL
ncbi:MAG: aminoacyl-tRNA hydrolase [Deltaproteobacteria bacterium]|nr:aminoacyl-tRNA hydrolase [Deltaproteobacteria bacterium]MBN2688509.1 aminoacyl-tRNA hydrolase [Deltaproteobacteria bacterium]